MIKYSKPKAVIRMYVGISIKNAALACLGGVTVLFEKWHNWL